MPHNKSFLDTSEHFLILRILQPITQWTEKIFGLTCFFWANIFIFLSLSCSILGIALALFYPIYIMNDRFILIAHIGLICMSLYRLLYWRKGGLSQIKKDAYKAMHQGCANPYINGLRISYPMTLVQVITRFGQVIGVIQPDTPWLHLTLPFLLYWIGLACAACTPLRPGKSKVRQLLEKAIEAISSREPTAQPA